MINKLTPKTGLIKKTLSGKVIKFSPDINIITGKCGAGKSILMKSITHYHLNKWNKGGGIDSSDHMQYNKVITDRDLRYYSRKKDILEVLHEESEFGKCDVDMDLSYQYFLNADRIKDDFKLTTDLWFCSNKLIDRDFYMENMAKVSSGQTTLAVFKKMMINVKSTNIMDLKISTCNDYDKAYFNIVKELYGDNLDKKPVMILDEPDTSMDLEEQSIFYNEFIFELAKKWQLIIASHSYFAHSLENVNHIRLDDHFENVKDLF